MVHWLDYHRGHEPFFDVEKRCQMKVGIPLERLSGERRVAATPESTKSLIKLGFEVLVEAGAGTESAFADSLYVAEGATIVDDVQSLYAEADIILKVNPPMQGGGASLDEVALLRPGQTLISFLQERN